MIPLKTAKTFSLSLLLSFTASIAAEGWTEWFKSKLTPKNVAIASTAGLAGAYSAYRWWTKPRLTQTLTLIDANSNEHVIAVSALNVAWSNYPLVRGLMVPNNAIDDHCYRVVNASNQNQTLLDFSPKYRLETDMTEDPHVEIKIFFSGNQGISIHRPSTSLLAQVLYSAVDESSLKQRYADELSRTGTHLAQCARDPKISNTMRLRAQAKLTTVQEKHTRVLNISDITN